MNIGFKPWDLDFLLLDHVGLKRELLHFDKIIFNKTHSLKGQLLDTDTLINTLRKTHYRPTIDRNIQELERLEENCLVEFINTGDIINKIPKTKKIKVDDIEELIAMKEFVDKEFPKIISDENQITENLNSKLDLIKLLFTHSKNEEVKTHRDLYWLKILKLHDTVPIYKYHSTLDLNCLQRRADVMKLVFNKMPLVDLETDWDRILEFKSDTDTKLKYSALKVWMNKIASSQMSAREIEDEIEYKIHQYRAHMDLHKLKFRDSKVEIYVNTTMQILANIGRLQFGAIAKSYFEIGKRELAVTEAELSLPGKEVAYIFKTNEGFK